MKASLTYKIALREVMKPILKEITENALAGRFCLLLLDLDPDANKELIRLGYRIERGQGTLHYIFW